MLYLNLNRDCSGNRLLLVLRTLFWVMVYVGVPTRGPGSQLVNAACFLVPDDDARGNALVTPRPRT